MHLNFAIYNWIFAKEHDSPQEFWKMDSFPFCCCKISDTKTTFVVVYFHIMALQFVKFFDLCILKCPFTRIAWMLIFFIKHFPICSCKIPATKTTFSFIYTMALQLVKFLDHRILKCLFTKSQRCSYFSWTICNMLL